MVLKSQSHFMRQPGATSGGISRPFRANPTGGCCDTRDFAVTVAEHPRGPAGLKDVSAGFAGGVQKQRIQLCPIGLKTEPWPRRVLSIRLKSARALPFYPNASMTMKPSCTDAFEHAEMRKD